MSSSNGHFLSENHIDSQCEYDGSHKPIVESFPNFSHNPQEGIVTNTLEYLKKKTLISDENVKDQDSETLNSLSYSNNYVSCTVNQKSFMSERLHNNESSKFESKVIPISERKLSVRQGIDASDELDKVPLEKKYPMTNYEIKLDDNNAKQVSESTFDSLPDCAFITIKKSKPIHNIALFISFNYDLSNYFSHEECNAHGFRASFRNFQDHVNIAQIVELVIDVVVNCWIYNWDITVFITSEPILPINVVTSLLKQLRVHFDRKVLEIVIIWINVFEKSRPWIDDQCRVAKATACIQGIEVSDVIPQIVSYFDNETSGKEFNGTTILFDEKKIICYHEFNNSYSAAMKIDDKIWLDVSQYFKAMKLETETIALTEVNSDNKVVSSESILRKALYNKFSQHSRLKHTLFSTRISSIYFTQDSCKCNLSHYDNTNSKIVMRDDPKISKIKELFINILEEIRYNLMQEERKRIEPKYEDSVNGEESLFLLNLV